MPHNLELKARIASIDVAEATARRIGASPMGILSQRDTYFIVRTGRLKLREFGDGTAELIAYERDERLPERWSHYEKVEVNAPEGLRRLLQRACGILAEVRKVRLIYQFRECRIHLDRVEGLGTFLEFEVQDLGRGESERLMEEVRGQFSVRPADVIQGSYSDMVSGDSQRA